MKIEEQTYIQVLFTNDEWSTVQQGLELLVDQQRNQVAARMLDIELPEHEPSTSPETPTPKRRGRPRKEGPKIAPTPEMLAEAARIQAVKVAGTKELQGFTMEDV